MKPTPARPLHAVLADDALLADWQARMQRENRLTTAVRRLLPRALAAPASGVPYSADQIRARFEGPAQTSCGACHARAGHDLDGASFVFTRPAGGAR